LEYAALMHDLGTHISYSAHHKHSYYLIRHGDLRGFHPDEIEVMALVARYHRRGIPRKSHQEYARLPSDLRRTVRALASILRVAKASTAATRNRSRPSNFTTAVTTSL
jgi:exopolyphosphatase/guanosine-5'-triphosphate,3'-diphosphate pyrophosphatase